MKKVTFSSAIRLPKINSPSAFTESSEIINEPRTSEYKSFIKLQKSGPKPRITSIRKKKEIYKTLDIIHRLSLESKIDEVFKEEILMEQKREKINNNKEIKEKRLGIFKKKEPVIEEKNQGNKIQLINNKLIEKYGMKEKEKKIEKKYNNNLKEAEKLEKEIEEVMEKMGNMVGQIDNKKLEINVIDRYGENIDKKQINSEEPIKIIEKKKSTRLLETYKKKDFTRRGSVMKITDVEKECKFIVKRYQRDEKHKKIQNKVDSHVNELMTLQKEYDQLREKYMNTKKQIFDLKKELVNIYHITLYEGLDFRNYGLATFILNIWNLGVNVDINFFPTYLDKTSIHYLFDKARKILYSKKLKKLSGDAELEYINTFNQWKEEEDESIINKSINNNRNFFKTKILETDWFYQQYPKTKLFMMNYNKKHEKESNKVGNIKVNNISFKSVNIPKIISEKNRKKEKIKYLINLHYNQMEEDEKNEILRISKEFLYNDYEKKYEVCIETIIGALVGEEKKDQHLNNFYKLKKEYKDNLKKIEFFNKLQKTFSV